MGRSAIKRRSSIFTIVIVLILIALVAICAIKIANKREENKENKKIYVSNLDEEDMMQYEYSKLDKSLDRLYAFAIKDNYVVGITEHDKFVNIYEIDPQKEYDYLYVDATVYILEKESGVITEVSLKNIGEVKKTIELGKRVESIDYYNKELYYLSGNKLYKYLKNNKDEVIEEELTAKNFVVKNGTIFVIKNSELEKITKEEKKTIASNVIDLNYYNYYERDRLIFDTTVDGINKFKNIYAYYDGSVKNSIKNERYYIPYDAFKYIYITNDQKSVIRVTDAGINEYIYKAEDDSKIQNVIFFKDGYILICEEGKMTTIELESKDVDTVDNITSLNNIRYIKITM